MPARAPPVLLAIALVSAAETTVGGSVSLPAATVGADGATVGGGVALDSGRTFRPVGASSEVNWSGMGGWAKPALATAQVHVATAAQARILRQG